jgi:hypothetical protein
MCEGPDPAQKASIAKNLIAGNGVIGGLQRLGDRPVRHAQFMQSHRDQWAREAGPCRGIVKLFRNRRAIRILQLNSYHA